MIQVEYLPIVLTGIGIIVSILYYTSVLRNANLQREKEFLQQKISIVDAEFYNNWRKLQQGGWSTYTEWLDYRDENPEIYGHFTYITMVLNGVGLLLRKNAMDPDLLFGVYTPNMIIWTWEILLSLIGSENLLASSITAEDLSYDTSIFMHFMDHVNLLFLCKIDFSRAL